MSYFVLFLLGILCGVLLGLVILLIAGYASSIDESEFL
jgi:uncharacterized membrane protein YccC